MASVPAAPASRPRPTAPRGVVRDMASFCAPVRPGTGGGTAPPRPPPGGRYSPAVTSAASGLLGFAAGLLIATVTAPVGVSGAVFLLPVQLSVLHVPNPAVTP